MDALACHFGWTRAKLVTSYPLPVVADHHSYVVHVCPNCDTPRRARKDVVVKAEKEGKVLMCKSCALKTRPVTWKKPPEELCINQGAYKSYSRAKRRVEANHNGAYGHVKFRFNSYEEFLAELGPRPEGMTLDRIDSNGHYEPGNVRWATIEQQARNRRNNIFVEYNGQKMCLGDAAAASGLHRDTIKRRLENNCPPDLLFHKGRIDFSYE